MAEPLDLEEAKREFEAYKTLSLGPLRDAGANVLAGRIPALVAEVERLRAELAAAKHRLSLVNALAEAADPQHHVPADGTLIVATYPDGQEHAFERVDVATVEDGEWWEVGADHPTPYGVILGHDEPPQDRPVVVVEPYVSLAHLRSALDGAS